LTYTIKIYSDRGVEEKSIYEETFGLPGKIKFHEVCTEIDVRDSLELANFAGVQSLCKAVLDWKGTIPGLRHDAGNSWLYYSELLALASQAALSPHR